MRRLLRGEWSGRSCVAASGLLPRPGSIVNDLGSGLVDGGRGWPSKGPPIGTARPSATFSDQKG